MLGLLALMLLIQSRQRARTTPDGELVLLADQDRSLWDRSLIDEGQSIVRECLRRNRPGPYQIQAAISAVHSDAPVAADTDWAQILQLYDQLLAVTPTPVVALNRAVALAEVRGADGGAVGDRGPGPRRLLPVPRGQSRSAEQDRPQRRGAQRV